MSDKLIMFVIDLCRHWEVVSPGDSRKEERAEKNLVKSARKCLSDMHYEERITCIIKYYATRLGQKITKTHARQMPLTWEQFLEVNEEE